MVENARSLGKPEYSSSGDESPQRERAGPVPGGEGNKEVDNEKLMDMSHCSKIGKVSSSSSKGGLKKE